MFSFHCNYYDNCKNFSRALWPQFLLSISEQTYGFRTYVMFETSESGQFDNLLSQKTNHLVDLQLLWQCYDEINDQQQDRCMKSWRQFVNFLPVESRCIPETFTSNDIVCSDLESSVSNKEEVKKLSTCSLITSYQFASNYNGTTRHKMLTSGKNPKQLNEYEGQIEVKVCYTFQSGGRLSCRQGGGVRRKAIGTRI